MKGAKFELALIPTETLIDEIMARCDNGVVATMKTGQIDGSVNTFYRKWKGNDLLCIALATQIAQVIGKDFEETLDAPENLTKLDEG